MNNDIDFYDYSLTLQQGKFMYQIEPGATGYDDTDSYASIPFLHSPRPIEETHLTRYQEKLVPGKIQPHYHFVNGNAGRLTFTIYVVEERLNEIPHNKYKTCRDYINLLTSLRNPSKNLSQLSPTPPLVKVFYEENLKWSGYFDDIAVRNKDIRGADRDNQFKVTYAEMDITMILWQNISPLSSQREVIPTAVTKKRREAAGKKWFFM